MHEPHTRAEIPALKNTQTLIPKYHATNVRAPLKSTQKTPEALAPKPIAARFAIAVDLPRAMMYNK